MRLEAIALPWRGGTRGDQRGLVWWHPTALGNASPTLLLLLKLSWSLASLIQAGFVPAVAAEKRKALPLPFCWMLGSKLGLLLLRSALGCQAFSGSWLCGLPARRSVPFGVGESWERCRGCRAANTGREVLAKRWGELWLVPCFHSQHCGYVQTWVGSWRRR